jgi:C1A family cysteine protease
MLFFFMIGLVASSQNFLDFINKHEKTYDNSELTFRLGVFEENLRKIEQLNKQAVANGGEAVYGVGPFADLTEEEFNRQYTGWNPVDISGIEAGVFNETSNADIDWRSKNAITPVKNQGSCGSCWAFAATEAIESEAFISKKYKLFVLGPQQIVSCDKASGGCNGGDPATAYKYIAANGMETEADYPYTAKTGSCKFDSSKVTVRISGQKEVSGGESGMATALGSTPFAVCHDTGGWQHYSGGVMTSCSSGGGHCTQAVGYASSGDYWIIKNSWGGSWGNSGYLYLKKGKNLCKISNHALYPTV